MLLDLDSDQKSLEERLNACRRIVASKTPSIIKVDDQLRSAAVDLVSLGAYGYCRKPPSIRDLKTLLRRGFEHTVLQRKLDQVQQSFEEVSYGCDGMIG